MLSTVVAVSALYGELKQTLYLSAPHDPSIELKHTLYLSVPHDPSVELKQTMYLSVPHDPSVKLKQTLYLSGAHDPSVLWNAMMSPLLPMTIFGAIWYQGNASILYNLCRRHLVSG